VSPPGRYVGFTSLAEEQGRNERVQGGLQRRLPVGVRRRDLSGTVQVAMQVSLMGSLESSNIWI
jgi:hypothetical protein